MRKLTLYMIMMLVLTTGVTAAEHFPTTVFDPIMKRNIPLERMTHGQLEKIIEQDSPLTRRYNDVDILKDVLEAGILEKGAFPTAPRSAMKRISVKPGATSPLTTYSKKRPEQAPSKRVAPRRAVFSIRSGTIVDRKEGATSVFKKDEEVKKTDKLTKEEIAAEFGIRTIYDPLMKRNVPIHYVRNRETLIAYLNHPVTQRVTFGSGQVKEVRSKIEKLGLVAEPYSSQMHLGRRIRTY